MRSNGTSCAYAARFPTDCGPEVWDPCYKQTQMLAASVYIGSKPFLMVQELLPGMVRQAEATIQKCVRPGSQFSEYFIVLMR